LSMTGITKSKKREGANKSLGSRGDRAKNVWTLFCHFMGTTEEGALELRS